MFVSTTDWQRWSQTALITCGLIGCCFFVELTAEDGSEPTVIARCQVVPLADHQVAFTIDGVEKVRWHFGNQYPRPFFFPFHGPSGEMLTRMGHPGAPDHDHHQSIWFANNKINGLDFWGNTSHTQIRQKRWLCYQHGPSEATMAALIGW